MGKFGWRSTVVAGLLACSGAAASGKDTGMSCDVNSDYDFALSERSVIFTRDTGTPRQLVMRQGRLFVDDRWVTLGAADRERLIEYERQARAAVPLAQELGRDAAEIAFIALGEVASRFSNDPEATRRKLEKARTQLDARLAQSFSSDLYDSDQLGEAIGGAVRDVLPTMIGDIVGGAVRAAFGGDTARLQRLEGLDAEIEALVEPRAEALGRDAEALCLRMRELDRIDDALDYRLPDGRQLDLLRVEVTPRQGHDGA